MPSASTAKLEKQASSEAPEPIKQVVVLVDHKIRNLIKKKGRLDTYRETQRSGKELEADQKAAILKYDEVCQNLNFAQDLSKQLNQVAQEWSKQLKKKEKKEIYEREQQEANKVKEILVIQDVLTSMGSDTVREDFLAGRKKAVQLSETELQYLDELFVEVSPKREPEEGQPPFLEQAQNAAKHLLNIVEGKDKEVVGTKYSVLKELIDKINNCGYFDYSNTQEPAAQEVEQPVVEGEDNVSAPEVVVEPDTEELDPEMAVPSATFQPSAPPLMEPVAVVAAPQVVESAGMFIAQRPMADVLTNVMGPGPTAFNFIQESELESPDVGVVPAVVAAPLPIPTQTFTNANFTPPPAAIPPVYAPPQQPEVIYTAPPAHVPVQPTTTYQNTMPPQSGGTGDWDDTREQPNPDWAVQVEQSEENRWNDESSQQQSDDWADSSNDGFQPATRGSGRGGRGRSGGSDRGRGGPRGGRGGGYQNGRGGGYGNNQNGRGGGGGYYNRNNDGGNNYYQNGYQSRGDGDRGERGYRDGGPRRGGPRGAGQDRGGPRQDRGGPRGASRGGNNPRGGNRGGNRQ